MKPKITHFIDQDQADRYAPGTTYQPTDEDFMFTKQVDGSWVVTELVDLGHDADGNYLGKGVKG